MTSTGRAGLDRAIWIALLVLAIAGTAVATYLTYIHYEDIKPICVGGSHGCEIVQASQWSKLAGVPVALLGLLTYVAILVSLLIRGELARMATAAITLIGFGYSAYLTYLELFEIDAICQWCVSSAVIMTLLMVLSVWRLIRMTGVPEVDGPDSGPSPEAPGPAQ